MTDPQTDPSDAAISLWLSIFYIVAVTAFGWYMVLGMWLFLSLFDPEDPDPTLVTDIIPYTVHGILSDNLFSLGLFVFFMLFIIVPLQAPGWWVIWKNIGKLRSLPRNLPSLIGLRRFAWAAAVAYLWAIIGVGGAICGFHIYLATLNPDFIWSTAENSSITDTLLIIGKILWLPAMIALIQFPGWLGLWWLNRSTSPMPDDPRWRRWHKGAVIYLKWSAIITVMIMMINAAIPLYGEFGKFSVSDLMVKILDMSAVELFALIPVSWFIFSMVMAYVISVVFFIQSPGWLVMAWLEWKKRQLARVINPSIEPLRLLQGAAIGYLAMVTAAWITWWFRLEYVGNHDFEDMLTPYLTPVLDGLLWAQIPGWAALCLWLALWLNQRQRTL